MRVAPIAFCFLVIAAVAGAQELPHPPKKDTPYLIHATNLLETETNQATEASDKKEQIYWVPGAASSARTPLGFPEFLFAQDQVDARTLRLYAFEPVNGRREVLIRKKNKIVVQAYYVDVIPQSEGLFKLRVDSSLKPGEYCLTPDGDQGSNTVFCFAVI
jgi:hypothetical protein